jgi:hypothetical protein
VLAQGGEQEGLAVIEAVHAGGGFAAYKRAFTRAAPMERARRALRLTTD